MADRDPLIAETARLRHQIANRNALIVVICGLLVPFAIVALTPKVAPGAASFCHNVLTAKAVLEDAGGDAIQPALAALKPVADECPTDEPDDYPD